MNITRLIMKLQKKSMNKKQKNDDVSISDMNIKLTITTRNIVVRIGLYG